jgi:uncharacterized OsmC-like protein
MYGTLAGALAARKVEFDRSTYTADVEGTIEGPDKQTIRITKIHLTYHVTIPAGQRETFDRALRLHPAGCPAHESVKDAIDVSYEADVTET